MYNILNKTGELFLPLKILSEVIDYSAFTMALLKNNSW